MRSPSVVLARSGSVALNLLFVSLVARFAGADTAGVFFASYATILVVSSLSRLGAEQYLIARLPRLDESARPVRISATGVAVVAMTISLVGISSLVLRGASSHAFWLFWLTTLWLSLSWLSVGALRGLGRYLQSVSLETLAYLTLFVVGLTVLSYFRLPTQTDLSTILALSVGGSCILGLFRVVRAAGRLPRPTASAVLQTVRESGTFWLASSLGVANAWIPILLLGQLAAPAEVSVFTLSHRLAALLLFGLMVLNARYAYDYARLMGAGRIAELLALYRRNTYAQVPFVAIAGIALIVFAPAIFEFSNINGEEASPVLMVLLMGTFASAVCGPTTTASITTGNADIVNTTTAATLAVSVLVVLALGGRIDSLLLAQIVAVTLATQNITMYFRFTARLKKMA